jgi:hypothetical protein
MLPGQVFTRVTHIGGTRVQETEFRLDVSGDSFATVRRSKQALA